MKTLLLALGLLLLVTPTADAKKTKKHKPHKKHVQQKAAKKMDPKKAEAKKTCAADYRGISGEEMDKCVAVRSMKKK